METTIHCDGEEWQVTLSPQASGSTIDEWYYVGATHRILRFFGGDSGRYTIKVSSDYSLDNEDALCEQLNRLRGSP